MIKKSFVRTSTACLIFVIAIVCPMTWGKHIIFDLGNVLLEHDMSALTVDMGLSKLLRYSVEDKKNPMNIPDILFQLMHTWGSQNTHLQATMKGRILPQIICDWMCGTLSSSEIMSKTLALIEEEHNNNSFCSDTEKDLLQTAVNIMFDPHKMVRYLKPLQAGMRILKKCAEQKNSLGMPAHTLVMLSNWDAASYNVLRKALHTKKIFSYFEPQNIIISSLVGMMKPHADIFQLCLQKCNAQPGDCIFIDDQEENIRAARALGFTALWVYENNFERIEQKLQRLGVFD